MNETGPSCIAPKPEGVGLHGCHKIDENDSIRNVFNWKGETVL